MSLFLPALANAVDDNGAALASAKWYFYRKSTLTPATTESGSSVTSDSEGAFAAITLTPGSDYRAILKDADGKTLIDIDAYADNLFAPASKVATDSSGNPLNGAKWKFYATGTTTAQSVYADEGLTTALGAVITANAVGRFPEIYMDDSLTYKAVLENAAGTELGEIDPATYANMLGYLDPTIVQEIEPGAAWDGTAGSGFTSAPSDPTRTTAKPAMRLVVPPNQAFTDTLLVGVIAAANYNGSLFDNLGLEKVRVYYENDTPTDILQPSFQTFADANGNNVTYFGWWITLKHNATNGKAQIYFEAVPKDATKQNRVMGPYTFLPSATLYDVDIEIAPSSPEVAGSSYQTTAAAMAYLRTQSAVHPRITFVEAGTYWFSNPGVSYNPDGYTTIEASTAVTIGRGSKDINDTSMRTRHSGLHFRGSNITIDFADFLTIYAETTRTCEHWFDGINLTNSEGRYSLFFKNHRDALNLIVYGNPYFTECTYTYLPRACQSASLARGNTLSVTWGDMMTGASCVIGNVSDDHDASLYRNYLEALTVDYTGSGASATLEMSGSNNATSRVLTAKVDGVSVGTFTVLRSAAAYTAGTQYNVQNVVDWINTLTDWTATLVDDTRVATSLQADGVVGAWGPIEVKGGNSLYTFFDVHADYAQTAGENRILAFNKATDLVDCQDFHFSDGDCSDIIAFSNAFANNSGSASSSNVRQDHSHVVIAHNTFAEQQVRMRTDQSSPYLPDAYCLFANNSFLALKWMSGTAGGVVIANNHYHTGETAPSGSTGDTVGGDGTSLYVDAANGDFTPAGDLLTNLKTAAATYDLNRNARATSDAAGAVRVSA